MFNSKRKSKKGFTLVEMLVVIAIIAVLVAIIVPTVTSATTKAKAATDAANLRSLIGEANTQLLDKGPSGIQDMASGKSIPCKTFPNAKAVIVYKDAAFLEAYYEVDTEGTKYYSLEYFQQIADKSTPTANAVSSLGTDANDVTVVFG